MKKHNSNCKAVEYFSNQTWKSVWCNIPVLTKHSVKFICNAKCGAFIEFEFDKFHLSDPTKREVFVTNQYLKAKEYERIVKYIRMNGKYKSWREKPFFKRLISKRDKMLKEEPLLKLFA